MTQLQEKLNEKLKELDPRYGIRSLVRTPNGKYEFEFQTPIDQRHFYKVRDILREVLGVA